MSERVTQERLHEMREQLEARGRDCGGVGLHGDTFTSVVELLDLLDDIRDARAELIDHLSHRDETIERLQAESRRFYNADGSFVELEPAEVVRRRIEAANDLVTLREQLQSVLGQRDDALNERDSLQAVIAMCIARMGGVVEGQPTGRVNFLQRIDELRAIEKDRDRLREQLANAQRQRDESDAALVKVADAMRSFDDGMCVLGEVRSAVRGAAVTNARARGKCVAKLGQAS